MKMAMDSMILFGTAMVMVFLMEGSVMVQDMVAVVELFIGRGEVVLEMVGQEEGMAVDSVREAEEDRSR